MLDDLDRIVLTPDNGDLSSGVLFTPTTGGVYQMRVSLSSDVAWDSVYVLTIDKSSNISTLETMEIENNDSINSPTPLTSMSNPGGDDFLGATVLGHLQASDSQDYFRIDADEGDRLFVTADVTDGDINPAVTIYSDNNTS